MNKLFAQIISFIGFSGIGWGLDFLTYTIGALLMQNLFLCNSLGAIMGVSFIFIFSTRYIFKNNRKIPLYLKYFTYILYQIVLIFLISKLLVFINNRMVSFVPLFLSAIIAKIFITPITLVLNFLVLKNIIEKM